MAHPRAGQPAQPEDLIDVDAVLDAYDDRVPDPDDPAQQVVFGTSGHRGAASTARSTRRTSWRSRRRSASTAPRRASRARSSSAGTPTRCRCRPGAPRSRCWSPTASRCSSTSSDGFTPTPAVSHAILRLNRERATGPARPTASSSRRRTTRPATAASSTTRRTAARPTPTPPAGSRTAPTSCCATGSADVAARDRRPRPATTVAGVRLPRPLRRRPRRGARHRRDPRRRGADRRRPAGRRQRRVLGRDRRAARARPHRGQPARRPALGVHDARQGRQDPDGLLVPVRDGVADRAASDALRRSPPATTPTPTGTASSRPTPG